jgi:hypothetical protein
MGGKHNEPSNVRRLLERCDPLDVMASESVAQECSRKVERFVDGRFYFKGHSGGEIFRD